MKPEDKQQYLDMIPRVFVRALRDPHGSEEFLLSEGEATDLLRRREQSLRDALDATSRAMTKLIYEGIDRGKGHWPAWDDCAQAVDLARAALSKATGKDEE